MWREIPNISVGTNPCLSPDESLIVTGSSHDSGVGSLKLIDSASFEIVGKIPISNSHVVHTVWNEKIQHLFVSSLNGEILSMFDPALSKKGIMHCSSR